MAPCREDLGGRGAQMVDTSCGWKLEFLELGPAIGPFLDFVLRIGGHLAYLSNVAKCRRKVDGCPPLFQESDP